MMISLKPSGLVVWSVLVSLGYAAAGCKPLQTVINGICCDLCPPGKYMKEFCSEARQTDCSPCDDGFFSHQYNVFDRCERCQSCQQDYADKCTPTTNSKCLCGSGFLCTNNVCSKCEANKCVMGEKVLRTGQVEYSYQCIPCPENEYYDEKTNLCKPRTQCIKFGRVERFPGNKTHDTICDMHDIQTNGVFLHVTVSILLSLTLLVFLHKVCINIQQKYKANKSPVDTSVVPASTADFHLSMEESGHRLIIQDESFYKSQVNLEIVHLS